MAQALSERIVSLTDRIGFGRLPLAKLQTLLELGCPDGARVLALGPVMIVLRSSTPMSGRVRLPGQP